MDKDTYEEAKKNLEEISKILKEGNLSSEEKQKFETLQAQLAGALLSPWLPLDWIRRLIMILLFFVGTYGLATGNYLFLVAWLIMLFFSPRFVGEFSYALGKFSRSSH